MSDDSYSGLEVFDISTVDGRRYVTAGGDLSRLRADQSRLRGDVGRLSESASERTTSPSSAKPTGGTSSTPHSSGPSPRSEDEESRLQRDLDHAVLDLASARRTLTTYRRGTRALVASTAVTALIAVTGIATAIVSSAIGVDASTAVMWLLVFGWSMALGSVAGLVTWIRMHRIKYEWIKRGGYTYDTYEIDIKDYVDPQRNVDIAELRYATALRKLTKQEG